MSVDAPPRPRQEVEILGYATRRRRSVALIAGLAVLAGALTYVLVRDRPPTYSAETSFSVSADSASELQIYVADFQVLLQSPEVLRAVEAATGEPVERMADRLSVERLEGSSTVSVGYVAASEDVATSVATEAAVAGLTALEQQSRQRNVADVEQLRAAVQAARTPLDELERSSATLFPEEEYRAVSAGVRDAIVREARARSVGDPVATQQAAAELAVLRSRQAALTSVVERYTPLRQAAEALEAPLIEAQRELAMGEISGRRDSVAARLTPGTAVRESRTQEIVQVVVVSALLAGVLGAAVLLLPDLASAARIWPSGSRSSRTRVALRPSRDQR